jgi:hypothetical protein
MDRLEEYIKNNIDNLNIYSPSPAIWRGIRRGLNSGKRPAVFWISIAASVAILIATSVISYQAGKGGRDIDGSKTSDRGLTNVSQQLKEAEVYYNNQINILYKEAAPLLTTNPELESELNYDLTQIDSICIDLRKDLKDNVANQEVVEALIQNYLIKIEILKEMLAILKEKENENNGEKNKSYEL